MPSLHDHRALFTTTVTKEEIKESRANLDTEELRKAIEEKKDKITLGEINKAIKTMPDRVTAVRERNRLPISSVPEQGCRMPLLALSIFFT